MNRLSAARRSLGNEFALSFIGQSLAGSIYVIIWRYNAEERFGIDAVGYVRLSYNERGDYYTVQNSAGNKRLEIGPTAYVCGAQRAWQDGKGIASDASGSTSGDAEPVYARFLLDSRQPGSPVKATQRVTDDTMQADNPKDYVYYITTIIEPMDAALALGQSLQAEHPDITNDKLKDAAGALFSRAYSNVERRAHWTLGNTSYTVTYIDPATLAGLIDGSIEPTPEIIKLLGPGMWNELITADMRKWMPLCIDNMNPSTPIGSFLYSTPERGAFLWEILNRKGVGNYTIPQTYMVQQLTSGNPYFKDQIDYNNLSKDDLGLLVGMDINYFDSMQERAQRDLVRWAIQNRKDDLVDTLLARKPSMIDFAQNSGYPFIISNMTVDRITRLIGMNSELRNYLGILVSEPKDILYLVQANLLDKNAAFETIGRNRISDWNRTFDQLFSLPDIADLAKELFDYLVSNGRIPSSYVLSIALKYQMMDRVMSSIQQAGTMDDFLYAADNAIKNKTQFTTFMASLTQQGVELTGDQIFTLVVSGRKLGQYLIPKLEGKTVTPAKYYLLKKYLTLMKTHPVLANYADAFRSVSRGDRRTEVEYDGQDVKDVITQYPNWIKILFTMVIPETFATLPQTTIDILKTVPQDILYMMAGRSGASYANLMLAGVTIPEGALDPSWLARVTALNPRIADTFSPSTILNILVNTSGPIAPDDARVTKLKTVLSTANWAQLSMDIKDLFVITHIGMIGTVDERIYNDVMDRLESSSWVNILKAFGIDWNLFFARVKPKLMEKPDRWYQFFYILEYNSDARALFLPIAEEYMKDIPPGTDIGSTGQRIAREIALNNPETLVSLPWESLSIDDWIRAGEMNPQIWTVRDWSAPYIADRIWNTGGVSSMGDTKVYIIYSHLNAQTLAKLIVYNRFTFYQFAKWALQPNSTKEDQLKIPEVIRLAGTPKILELMGQMQSDSAIRSCRDFRTKYGLPETIAASKLTRFLLNDIDNTSQL